MTLEWTDVDRRARHEDHDGLTALLLTATEEERLAFAPAVEAGVKRAADDTFWPRSTAAGFLLAVIATMPSAARTATLMNRRDLRGVWRDVPVPQFLRIAAARNLPWLGDLGIRLAHKLPATVWWATGDWRLTAAVLTAGGAGPPVTEAVVRQWVCYLLRPGHRHIPPLLERMRDDPWLDLLMPAVFEIDGIGATVGCDTWNEEEQHFEDEPRLPGMIAALVAEGRLDRRTILTATVDRLVRGDKPGALRPFVRLHELLAPTLDEMAGHAADYARLLAEAPGTIATLAQQCLRMVDDAGRLELQTLLEASGPVLLRTEKTLVKKQLTWLSPKVRARPGEVCETIAVAFGHPALEIQERALTLVGKAVPTLDADVVRRLAGAGEVLTGDLPARAAALFGGTAPASTAPASTAPASTAPAPILPPPAAPAPMPPPITGPAELAEEIAVLAHDGDAVRWERVLAGIVALRNRPSLDDLGPAITASSWMKVSSAFQEPPADVFPHCVVALRAHEIAVSLTGRPVPVLLATPTHVNGSLDAAVLADRLARAEAEGCEPWPLDLEQALLRVPRDADPAVAAGLTSPAGRRFAAWLGRGGLPDPISERHEQVRQVVWYGSTKWESYVSRRVVAAVRPATDDGLALAPLLLRVNPSRHPADVPYAVARSGGVLPMALPHHREVIAAHALPGLAGLADLGHRGAGATLSRLAECTGPIGPAMTYGLAYAFGAKQQADRVAATDAFLMLAAGREPFAAAVGEALADLCSDGLVKPNRVAPALADAHRSGASAAVWDVLAAALPSLLTGSARAVADMLEVATQVAVTLGPRPGIAGLAEVAARPGGSRLVKEAQRLLATLSRPA